MIMKNCPSCGNQCRDNDEFCQVCGARLTPAAGGAAPEGQTFKDKAYDAFNNTADTTADYSPEDISSNKVFAILSYFGLLFLVAIIAAPNSKFAKFHANQGLVLFIADLIICAVAVIPFIGWIVSSVGGVACLVLSIIGIINAAQGNAKELPIIGKYRILK